MFPRRENATNEELILTIINIQAHLQRYGESHTNWHETLNEVIDRLKEKTSVLDEMKSEIERLPITDTAVRLVTEVIDKYTEQDKEEAEE